MSEKGEGSAAPALLEVFKHRQEAQPATPSEWHYLVCVLPAPQAAGQRPPPHSPGGSPMSGQPSHPLSVFPGGPWRLCSAGPRTGKQGREARTRSQHGAGPGRWGAWLIVPRRRGHVGDPRALAPPPSLQGCHRPGACGGETQPGLHKCPSVSHYLKSDVAS